MNTSSKHPNALFAMLRHSQNLDVHTLQIQGEEITHTYKRSIYRDIKKNGNANG